MSSLFSVFYLDGGGFLLLFCLGFGFVCFFPPSRLKTDASTFSWDFQALWPCSISFLWSAVLLVPGRNKTRSLMRSWNSVAFTKGAVIYPQLHYHTMHFLKAMIVWPVSLWKPPPAFFFFSFFLWWYLKNLQKISILYFIQFLMSLWLAPRISNLDFGGMT